MTYDQTLFNIVSGMVGALLSLLLTYVPVIRVRWAEMDAGVKALIMLGLTVLAAGLIVGSSCLNLWPIIVCEKQGFMDLAEAFFLVITANQVAFTLSKPPSDVLEVKMAKLTNKLASVQTKVEG